MRRLLCVSKNEGFIIRTIWIAKRTLPTIRNLKSLTTFFSHFLLCGSGRHRTRHPFSLLVLSTMKLFTMFPTGDSNRLVCRRLDLYILKKAPICLVILKYQCVLDQYSWLTQAPNVSIFTCLNHTDCLSISLIETLGLYKTWSFFWNYSQSRYTILFRNYTQFDRFLFIWLYWYLWFEIILSF